MPKQFATSKYFRAKRLKFSILALSTNFCLIEIDLYGNTVWPQASGFQKVAKLTIFGIFNEAQNANEARFARNVEWYFFVIFKHCDVCFWHFCKETLLLLILAHLVEKHSVSWSFACPKTNHTLGKADRSFDENMKLLLLPSCSSHFRSSSFRLVARVNLTLYPL